VLAHKAALAAAQQHYEAAVVNAKREHAAAVAGEKARWQVRVGHAQQLWELQKEDTMYQHNRRLEEVSWGGGRRGRGGGRGVKESAG
jgi:hypothetical protein